MLHSFVYKTHLGAAIAKRAIVLGLVGFIVGLVVLGLGGRILMRLLAFVTPEPPRFTLGGTLQIIGAGAVWGGITAPLLMVVRKYRPRFGRAFGSLFGMVVMAPGLVLFMLFSGFDGDIVAPRLVIVGTVVLFPLLFIMHGIVLESIIRPLEVSREDQEPTVELDGS
jgi:MFS family permease